MGGSAEIRCPKCDDAVLARERALTPPVFACATCRGLWLMPGEAEILRASAPSPPAAPPRSHNDKVGGLCPFGHGLLDRARVEVADGGGDFFLERCRVCSGVFFDDGEWARLAHSRLFAHLDELWEPLFQKRLAEEKSQQRWRATLVERLSAQTVDRLEALAHELIEKDEDGGLASDALAYLSDALTRERDAQHTRASEVFPRRMRKVDAVLLHVLPAHVRVEQYRPASLDSEGFVHLCHRDQLLGVLERHFGFARDLDARAANKALVPVNVLVLDSARLLHPVREERVGDDGIFPHLYGELRLDAVLRVVPLAASLGHDEILRLIDDAIELPQSAS